MKSKTLNKDQQRLVSENLEMAEQLAGRFGSFILYDTHEKCITMDDLKMEAVLGLSEAAMRYDSALGVAFSTYAFIWCRKFVLRAVRKYGTPVSVPDNFTKELELAHLDAMMSDVASAYADSDDSGSPADRVYFQIAEKEEAEENDRSDLHERIELALSGLNPQERKAVTCLFGLKNEPMSGVETADELGVVPGRVSQIKERALRKMEMMLAA